MVHWVCVGCHWLSQPRKISRQARATPAHAEEAAAKWLRRAPRDYSTGLRESDAGECRVFGDIDPIHFHRHSFEITSLAGRPTGGILKDVAMPGGCRSMDADFTADQLGLSLFHCHTQLHMDYGFMALVDCA